MILHQPLLFSATEIECDYPETVGDDYGDDDLPDMEEVSITTFVKSLNEFITNRCVWIRCLCELQASREGNHTTL